MADRKQPHTPQDDSPRDKLSPDRPSSKTQPRGELAAIKDQDFSPRPGFGGYGPDGGGYGSQTSYASHNQYQSQADNSQPVTRRTGTGATSSHTGTGTQTPDTATGASHGSTFGGATTASEEVSKDEASNTDTPSRGPGSESGLAGRSVSSSSTAIPEHK
ncbi:MAG: hypothetical protein V4637_12640 [Pseudomonadota bacterium]